MELCVDDLSVTLDGAALVRELSLDVERGRMVALVGPNGSGKSTVLRCVYGALKPSAGRVLVDGTDLSALGLRRAARQVAALTQQGGTELDFTVAEVVALGRTPHLRGNQPLSERERTLCEAVMADLDVLHLADRGVLGLSGGELQRVLIARALVQEPRVLVLDEPTNHLDLRHQVRLLSLLRARAHTVLVVLHDLNLAAACDTVGVLSQGRLVASGAPADVLTRERVRDVFGLEVTVVEHPLTGNPQLLYSLDEGAEGVR
ncbi:ABC transporter ATP-binding protein [Nocardiopsis sp. YSL2]|uniref:ABC transporter ATP-binding protein n=1 Tax=Nocardiopsis sp. YSL2 TaxID=2939492 RepID=UPI0026F413B7|nr:ABC transporter ATP-binding protein [Nocardiopsis sp. YSL2]